MNELMLRMIHPNGWGMILTDAAVILIWVVMSMLIGEIVIHTLSKPHPEQGNLNHQRR